MDIVIVGAGVGGLALANGLVADGHRVRVLERADAPRTDGTAVTIFSNGAAAAAGLGVPLDDLGGSIDTLGFFDPDGRPFAHADLALLRRWTGHGVTTIPRPVLLQRLASGLPADAVHYGERITRVETSAAGAAVVTADGVRREADLVVGADGYRSVVRRATLGDGEPALNGWVSWQGLTTTMPELAAGAYARCMVGPPGLCGLMPAGGGLLQWWFDVHEPAPAGRPVIGWLRERFAGFADPVRKLLDVLTEADVHAYRHVLHEIPDRWGAGAATLLGDAAHAFPPSQPQGANQALEDAWLLRRALQPLSPSFSGSPAFSGPSGRPAPSDPGSPVPSAAGRRPSSPAASDLRSSGFPAAGPAGSGPAWSRRTASGPTAPGLTDPGPTDTRLGDSFADSVPGVSGPATGPVADALRRYERVRARRVRRIAALAASEVTNRPPSATGRLAARMLGTGLFTRLQLTTIRRSSSVLNDDRV